MILLIFFSAFLYLIINLLFYYNRIFLPKIPVPLFREIS